MSDYTVSASIVSYGGFEEVQEAAATLLQHTKAAALQLYLIDNNSPDGTGERLAEVYQDNPQVTVCNLTENIGFGKGHNVCLDKISSDYHAVVNPDIIIDHDVLKEICTYMQQHPDVVMVTPQLRFPTGEIQNVAKRKPTVLALAARQLPLKFLKKYETHYLMLDEDLSVPHEVEFCSGCFFVMRTDVLKQIGGFDPAYFMYVEDADITQKALQVGKAVYLPTTYVFHAWHRAAHSNFKHFSMQMKSMMRYFKKWGFSIK
ncbi:MAG: glycosyltransferase family 2 protein [Oscillospiraceae bacterium]|nr:glycosyltransferase family 2 protein [Oscillospiraceae bacterium]